LRSSEDLYLRLQRPRASLFRCSSRTARRGDDDGNRPHPPAERGTAKAAQPTQVSREQCQGDDSDVTGRASTPARRQLRPATTRAGLLNFTCCGFRCRRKARFRASVASDLRRVCVIDFVEITRGETGRIYWWISDRSVPNSIWEESSSYRTRFGSGK
jgi:hypothetical protein